MKEDLFSTYCNITAIFGGNKQKEMGGERETQRHRETQREKSFYGSQKRGGGRTCTEEEGTTFVLQRPNVSTRCLGKKIRGLFGGEFGQGFLLLLIFLFVSILRNSPPSPKQKHFFRSVFFLAIVYYCQNGDHPQEDLAKFG